MPQQTGIRWVRPPSELAAAVERYGDQVWIAVTAVAQYIATKMQNEAKANAPWTDRTGNARSGLFGTAEYDAAQKIVTIFLSHGATINYGVSLELAHGGAYAILMRTIETNLPELQDMLQDLFR